MKNNLADLNDYLFEELERLNDDEELDSEEKLDKEIKRSKAITNVAQQIINNANTVLDSIKFTTEYGIEKDMPKLLTGESKNNGK